MDLKEELYNFDKEEYGTNYHEHLLEQYKMYVEMTDRISARRQTSNSFFLSINTAIITLLGYTRLKLETEIPFIFILLLCLCGMVICYMWYRLTRSYKDLNSGKFKVIHEIEKRLPISPYDAEWVSLGEGKNKELYLPFTHIEISIPWVFFILYVIILLLYVPWESVLCNIG